jgi:hypothetical protein
LYSYWWESQRERYWWMQNIKMDFGEIEGVGVIDWICLAQDRDNWRPLVNKIMNLYIPYNTGRCLSGCTTSCIEVVN